MQTESQPDREEITERVLAMPQIAEGEILEHSKVGAFMLDLARNGSKIPEHVDTQIELILEELVAEYGEDFPLDILKNIVNRAGKTAAAQVVSDTGRSFIELDYFKQLLGLKHEVVTTTSDTDEE